MTEGQYRFIGWCCLILTIGVALTWCLTESGLTGKIMQISHNLIDVQLKQISCVATFIIVILPGYIIKRYCDELAWDSHLSHLPPPDVRESAKKSKYINLDDAPPLPPQPVQVSSIPDNQPEFIATCGACGHLFSARKDIKSLQCPNCGENIPLI